jgi:tetratricopeptide (TPR) repeat protein
MKQTILFFLLVATCPLLHGQKLGAWLTPEIQDNPQAYITKAAKFTPATPIEAAGNFFALGKCYAYLNQENIALKYFLLSRKEFEKLKQEGPVGNLALEIHQIISSQENYDKYGNSFLQEYFAFAQKTGSDEYLAYAWNEFAKEAFSQFDYDNRSNPKVLDSARTLFQKALNYALPSGNALVTSKVYTNIGTLENTRQNFSVAKVALDKGRKYAFETRDPFELFVNYYNYGNSYFLEGNYPQAIAWFKKAEELKMPKFRDKTRRIVFKKLMEANDAVDNQAERRRYQKLYLNLDKSIKDGEQNAAIHDINVKYQVAEKDRQISSLEQFKEKFHNNRLVFGLLLFGVFALAMYSFVRWKKVDYRKRKLEQENMQVQEEKMKIEVLHSRTVEELEKVKSIVTEGHIILKDGMKIYLNDLMYVKSEDHYLHAFSQDGKKHFVRGKLSHIQAELPPNFAKCHRSYIVNTNYIQSVQQGFLTLKNKEEIPVSRGFKL